MNPDFISPSEGKYIEGRIEALRRNGAIRGLRDEARDIRQMVAERLLGHPNDGGAGLSASAYEWVATQLRRAEAFESTARVLDADRPAGAAGLAS